MYKIKSIYVLIPLLLVVAGCSETQKVYDNTPLQGPYVSFGVAGMGCPKCANNITLLLEKVDGV